MIRGPIHQEELMVTDMHLPLRAVRDIKKKMAKQNCKPVGPTTLTGGHNNAPLSGDRESSTKWSQMIPKWMQFKKKKDFKLRGAFSGAFIQTNNTFGY